MPRWHMLSGPYTWPFKTRKTGIRWRVLTLALVPALVGILLWCAGWICGLALGVFSDGLTRGWSFIEGGGRWSVCGVLKARANQS